MGEAANTFFDFIALLFVLLTIVVVFFVVSIAAGTMDSPILAPDEPPPLPTEIVFPTLTPSPAPGAALTPAVAPTPTAP